MGIAVIKPRRVLALVEFLQPTLKGVSNMKLLIVGGVTGVASAAAWARRISEEATIIVFPRGPDVSFANCGLPYHVGEKIAELLVLSGRTTSS